MNSPPVFSVITVCRNNLQGLKLTFESIRTQTFQDMEWIVIDGNSTDGTVEYMNNLHFPNSFLSEPDGGIYDAMNKGVKFVNGRFVVYMNSGDTFFDDTSLQLAHNLITKQTQQVDILLCGFELMLPNGMFIQKKPRNLANYIWHGMPTCHQAILFSRKSIEENPYDTSYKISGDYQLLASIFSKGCRAIYSKHPFTVFEVGGASFSHPWLLMSEAYRVKREVLRQGWILNILSFIKSCISIYGLRVLSFKR